MKSIGHEARVPPAPTDAPEAHPLSGAEESREASRPVGHSPLENSKDEIITSSRALGIKRPASKSPSPEAGPSNKPTGPPPPTSVLSHKLTKIQKTEPNPLLLIGVIYTDGTKLSPPGSSFRGWNGDKHWKKRMKQEGMRAKFNAIGIFNKDQYKADVVRIANSPTSAEMPGFIRRSDLAAIRYDKVRNFFLIVDSEGSAITKFMPGKGFEAFESELKK